MTSTSTPGQQHWYLKLVTNPLLRTLRSVAIPPRQMLSHAPFPSDGQHWYARLVLNPLPGLLRSVAVLLTQLLRSINHVLKAIKKILILFQRLIVNPLLHSPRFTVVFTSQLLKFNPNQPTPGEPLNKSPWGFDEFLEAL